MILFRRAITIVLIIITLLLFTAALLLTEINSTVFNPGFYKNQLEHADIYNFILDEALPAALDEIEEDESSDLPVELTEFKSDVVPAVREILSPEWLQGQFESAIGRLVPYLRGSTDEFTILIQLLDKVDPTADAIMEIFGAQQTYDYLGDQIITPVVAEQFGDGVDLPFEVGLSQAEISSALQEVWIHDFFVEIVRACAAYVKGAETISVDIDLTDKKGDASDVITALADQKLEAKFDGLPEVSNAEFLLEIEGLPPGHIPHVRAEGMTYDDFKEAIGLDVGYWVDQMVIDQLPNPWSLTEEDVITIIGSDLEDVLYDAHDNIASGYNITEADLRDEIAEGEGDPDDLDQARGIINTIRIWLWVLWLVPIILVLCAGLLIARSLKGKLLWFLGILFVMFFIFCITAIVVHLTVGEPELNDPADYQGFDLVMVEKGNEIADNAIGTFILGIQKMCLYTMLASGIIFVGIILLFHRDRLYPVYNRCRGRLKSWRNRNKVSTS